MNSPNRKRRRDGSSTSSSSSSSSKASKWFVAVATPIVMIQLLVVYKFLRNSPRAMTNDSLGGLLAHQQSTYQREKKNANPEGTFNGYPIYFEDVSDQSLASQVHCIGESYENKKLIRRIRKRIDVSWQHRSCHFHFFCYDLEQKEYVLYQSPKEKEVGKFPTFSDVSQSYMMVNQSHHDEGIPFAVAIGGINRKWMDGGILRLKWYPTIRSEPPKNFYSLPADVVMIPFHSLASFNPGHLVWDDFLPIYTLMQIFGLDSHQLLAMRYILPGDGLWAACDWKEERNQDCNFMLKKFGTLMVSNHEVLPFSTNLEPRLEVNGKAKSNMVCAKQGAAGLGSLTDHGTRKGHGWEAQDYRIVHNLGRGGQLWRFRNFMMQKVGVPVTDAPPPNNPFRIIFSEGSSRAAYRNLSWKPQIAALEAANLGEDVVIESYLFHKYTLKEQVEIAGQAAIFITAAGGGAVTATFLPRGASAILFYGADTGLINGKRSFLPARLDFDYFNNMAYVRSHWIGYVKASTMRAQKIENLSPEQQEDVNGFVTLVQHDLDLIRKARAQYDEMVGNEKKEET